MNTTATDAALGEHEAWSLQLAARLDGELDAAAQRRLDEHLSRCARCRGELKIQQAVQARLVREPLVQASRRLRERVAGTGAAPAGGGHSSQPASRAQRRRRWRRGLIAGGGWAAAAVLALMLLWSAREPQPRAREIPMVADALADFRLHARQALVAPSATPAQLMQSVLGWSTPPLPLRDASLISAWQTRIGGEAAVALAYRSGNHVIVQYIVSEAVFFRQPAVREALADEGVFRADAGAERLVARPGARAGHLLVGAPRALDHALAPL